MSSRKPRFDSISPPLSEYPQRSVPRTSAAPLPKRPPARAVSALVPFIELDDGSRVLTDTQIAGDPALAEFVSRYPQCFERDHAGCCWVFHSDGRS